MGELQKIVDGADDRPLGAHLLEAAQQELAEAASLFDLPQHRLRKLLAQPVRAFVAAGLDLGAHRRDAASASRTVLGPANWVKRPAPISPMAGNYLVFGDIEGNLHVLRVECTKCTRRGRYHVRKLISAKPSGPRGSGHLVRVTEGRCRI